MPQSRDDDASKAIFRLKLVLFVTLTAISVVIIIGIIAQIVNG